MTAGSSGSTHGDSTLATPAPNAMSGVIWDSTMKCNFGVSDFNMYPCC